MTHPNESTPPGSSNSRLTAGDNRRVAQPHAWGSDFEPDALARIELRAWKAYYRRQPMRLFALLVLANRAQASAAEVRDRGATADPDGPKGPGTAYWPEVARLLRDSYRALRHALDARPASVSSTR